VRRIVMLALLVALGCHSSSATTAPTMSATPASPSSSAQPAAAKLENVSFGSGASGHLAVPAGTGKHAAILLVPEWWGLNPWIDDDASRFAAQGYVALGLDIYRGKATSDPSEAHELMRGLPEDRAADDMKAAVDWLVARADVDPQRVGVIGWCMGGGYALSLAVSEPRLRAAVVNYGKLVTAPEKVGAIHAALLGNFAGADRGIAPDDVRAFADQLKAAHKDADVKIYDGAKHAFMNPNNKDGYDDAAAQDAWGRIDSFFARTLKKSE
jgi:carboxymethylenebutenolidase